MKALDAFESWLKILVVRCASARCSIVLCWWYDRWTSLSTRDFTQCSWIWINSRRARRLSLAAYNSCIPAAGDSSSPWRSTWPEKIRTWQLQKSYTETKMRNWEINCDVCFVTLTSRFPTWINIIKQLTW